MSQRTRLRWLALLFTAAGCAGLKPPETPYAHLNRDSYGPLMQVGPRSCDPMSAGGVDELSRQITALIAKPFSGISQVDPAIDAEGLTGSFKIPGDPSMPPVTLLSRDDDSIVFWHELSVVPVSETATAAQTYCGRLGRRPLWLGSAERCGPVQRTMLSVNGQQVAVHPTYVISAYACVAPGASPGRHRRGG